MKVELVVDATGIPLGLATCAASVPETVLVVVAVGRLGYVVRP